MFEPTIFPMAILPTPFKAARIETANSGADVPNANMVRPITSSEIPKRLAILDALSTSQAAP